MLWVLLFRGLTIFFVAQLCLGDISRFLFSNCLSFCAVSGMWAKKNAVGKQEVAKLVDDIYRCVLILSFLNLPHMISCSILSHFS